MPPVIPPTANNHWVNDVQPHEVMVLRQQRDDALWHWGEYVMLVLMWTQRDFEAGRVGRCPTCYLDGGKINEAYGQATRENCPDCYGTTFEGGFRAKIVRPAVFNDGDIQDEALQARGTVATSATTFETLHDFRMHNGDYILRGNGERYQFQRPDDTPLHTGFNVKGDESVNWNIGVAMMEQPTAVVFLIPPNAADLIALLDIYNIKRPRDLSAGEEANGPLEVP